MMSLATLQAENERRKRIASRRHIHPFIVEATDLDAWRQHWAQGDVPRLPFPHIGNYRPRGWKLEDTLFVDSTGWGDEDEPALTVRALLARLRPGYGYAIIEAGQFQCYVGEFRPPSAVAA